jgi:hypothetical protein
MKGTAKILILSLTALFSLMAIIQSFYYSGTSGGSDLRNRIVGARAMGRGYSPYFYKWRATDGERLLDPNDIPSRLANGNTVTPAFLRVSYPLSLLSYPYIRLIWTILQLLAAVAIVWAMVKRNRGSSPLISACVVILGLLASDYWFCNIERGQIYIFYTLLFASVFYVYTSKYKYAEFLSGFIGGLFIFFRPFAGIIGLGFLLHGKIKWVKGCLTGVVAGMLIFVAPDPGLWQNYFKAMEEYENTCMGKGHIINDPPKITYPGVIEGMDNLSVFQNFNIDSMPHLYGYFRKLGLNYTPLFSYIFCAFIYLILSIFFFRIRTRSTPERLFLFAFLAYMVASLFFLSWRGSYAIIEWVFPLFLVVQLVRFRLTLMILLVTALLFLHNVPFHFHYQALTGELILLLLVAYFTFSNDSAAEPDKQD